MNDLRDAAASFANFIDSPLAKALFIGYVAVIITYGGCAFIGGWWPCNWRRKRS